MSNALVLLSGLDSAVAMHWARSVFDDISAISFWYGQPHAAAEIAASQTIAQRRGVPWASLNIAEAVRGLNAISVPKPGMTDRAVSRANLPARNMILLSIAAAHGSRLWQDRDFSLIIGANEDDAEGFPDCRERFLDAAREALRLALAGMGGSKLDIRAPWVERRMNKMAIIRWAASAGQEALDDARFSVSCYAGTRCGSCDACMLRASAFKAAGIDDGTDTIVFRGGDPGRNKR